MQSADTDTESGNNQITNKTHATYSPAWGDIMLGSHVSLWMSLWQSDDSCHWLWQAHARYKTNNSQWTIIDGNVQWHKIVLRMSLIVLARICYHCRLMMQLSYPAPLSIVKIIKISSMEPSHWQLVDEGCSFHHDDPDPIISAGSSLLLQPPCSNSYNAANMIVDFWYL